jgi:COMPASS component SWD3
MSGSEAFIVSGSENGELLFWDVKSKEILQRVSGHDGVVMWVDTCPGQSGKLVSGGLDGTVRIWVDVNEDDYVHGLRAEHENGVNLPGHDDHDDEDDQDADMIGVKAENGSYGDDAQEEGMSVDTGRASTQDAEDSTAVGTVLDGMES